MGAISASAHTRSIGHNALFALIAQLTGAAFTAALTIFLARELGSARFGVLTLALGVAGMVLVPSDLGISSAVARLVALAADRAEAAGAVRVGLQMKLLVAIAVAAALFVLAPVIAAGYGIAALSWPLRGAALALAGQNVMQLGVVFIAAGQTRLQWLTALLESASELTASVLLVLAGAGAAGAAFGQAIGYLLGALATVALIGRLLGRDSLALGRRPGAGVRAIAAYASVLLLVDGAYTAFTQIDTLIIAADRHAAQVAFFSAPLRLIVLLSYPGEALAAGVGPRLARAGAGDRAAFIAALRILIILQLALAALVLGWSAFIIRLTLGGGYGASATALQELCPFVVLSGFGALVSVSVNYLGSARHRVPVALATVALNLVLDLILIPPLGIAGACIGTDVAFALYVPAHLLICRNSLGLALAPLAPTVARAAVSAAAMLAVGLILGDGAAAPLGGGLALALGLCVFAAGLWLSGELRRGDLARLGALLRRARADTPV